MMDRCEFIRFCCLFLTLMTFESHCLPLQSKKDFATDEFLPTILHVRMLSDETHSSIDAIMKATVYSPTQWGGSWSWIDDYKTGRSPLWVELTSSRPSLPSPFYLHTAELQGNSLYLLLCPPYQNELVMPRWKSDAIICRGNVTISMDMPKNDITALMLNTSGMMVTARVMEITLTNLCQASLFLTMKGSRIWELR